MIKPVTPIEVGIRKGDVLPPEVIEAFNELILEDFVNDRARVKKDAVVQRILSKMETNEQTIFERGWLNVEEMYRAAGWKVTYDAPAYNETYSAAFMFERERK